MIYTTSCSNKDHADLKPLLEKLDARLIDVRFSPAEMPIKWSKGYLRLLLKRGYQHLPALGAREISPGKFAIQNPTLGLKVLGEESFNIVLMCDCSEYNNCHRKIIADEFKKFGKEVEEIYNWKL